ncbi:hypothetical protein L0F63_002272, partial [Massospora cicadina]
RRSMQNRRGAKECLKRGMAEDSAVLTVGRGSWHNGGRRSSNKEAQKMKLQALPDLKHTLDQRWVRAKHAKPLISAQALK